MIKTRIKRILSMVLVLLMIAGLMGVSFADQAIKANVNGVRIAGVNRYGTAQRAFVAMQALKGTSYVDNVVIATGENYPDALSAAYFANKKNAALLLSDRNDSVGNAAFIASRYPYANVYIIGGTDVISKETENLLKATVGNVARVHGLNRYETNLKVLSASGAGKSDLLVCSGKNYPDALSASGVKLPILLVGNTLTETQKKFLAQSTTRKIYIVGGVNAVSQTVESQLSQYGTITRFSGYDRFETSALLADYFYGGKTKGVVLARGDLYPDGLVAGPLAMKKGYPILLVHSNNYKHANRFVANNKIGNSIVMGGKNAVSSQLVTNTVTWNASTNSEANPPSDIAKIVKYLKANKDNVPADISSKKRKIVNHAMLLAKTKPASTNGNCYQLVYQAYKAAGIEIGALNYGTVNAKLGWYGNGLQIGKRIEPSAIHTAEPGDILYYVNGVHVAIYIGNGLAVHGGWNWGSTTAIDTATPRSNQLISIWQLLR